MFDNNDQNAQATNTQAQPAVGQNTTVPDIADPNLTTPSLPASDPIADPAGATSTPPVPPAQDLSSSVPAADNTDSNAAFVSPTVSTPDPASLPTLDPTAEPETSNPVAPETTNSEPAIDPAADFAITPDTSSANEISPTIDSSPASSSTGGDDLLNIKKDALQNLTPLLDHLDQAPEDKFRTTMMLIQASDDKSLIQSAYNAAQQISDEKEKAQALLDIVNEINYFTQEAASNKSND